MLYQMLVPINIFKGDLLKFETLQNFMGLEDIAFKNSTK